MVRVVLEAGVDDGVVRRDERVLVATVQVHPIPSQYAHTDRKYRMKTRYACPRTLGADFKNNQTTKQLYLDQQEASKFLFLPFYWHK